MTKPNTTDLAILATLAEMDAKGDVPILAPRRGEGKAYERLRRNGLVVRRPNGTEYRITQAGVQLAAAMCTLLDRTTAVILAESLRRMADDPLTEHIDHDALRHAADVIVPDPDYDPSRWQDIADEQRACRAERAERYLAAHNQGL